MSEMRIRRYGYRRGNRAVWLGCAAVVVASLVICGVSALLLLPSLLPQAGLAIAGFEQAGSTNSVFSQNQAQPIPTVQVQNAAVPAQVVVDAGSYGTFTIDNSAINAVVGESAGGGQVATVTFDEGQLLALCQQRTVLCSEGDGRVRRATIDLRPGGAVINGEFYVPQVGVWQRAGLVLTLNSTTAQFDVAGIDVGGVLYNVPEGSIGDSVDRIVQTGNAILREVAVSAGGSSGLQPSEIYADDRQLTLILR